MARDRFRFLERNGFLLGRQSLSNCHLSLAVEPACQLVALDLREWHHTCLASRISMASTHGSLRQRLALRTAHDPPQPRSASSISPANREENHNIQDVFTQPG